MSTLPCASSTACGTKFSEAISSSVLCWRSSSTASASRDRGIDLGERAREVVGRKVVAHSREPTSARAIAAARARALRARRARRPRASKRAQVDDGRGGPGQLAAVELEVDAGADRRRHLAERPRRPAPPARFALDCSTGRVELEPDIDHAHARAARRRRAGSGAPGLGRAASAAREQRRERGARARAQLRAAPRAPASSEKNASAAGLPRRAALEREEAIDAPPRCAGRSRARRRCRRRTARRRPRRGSARARRWRGLPLTATRAHRARGELPARSRWRLDVGEAGRRAARPRPPRPGPSPCSRISVAARRARRPAPISAASTSRPPAPPSSARRGSWRAISGSSAAIAALVDVGRVGDDRVIGVGQAVEQIGAPPVRPRAAGARRWRARRRARRRRRRIRRARRSGRSSVSASAIAPRAAAAVEDARRRPASSSASSTSSSVSGRGISTRASTASSRRRNARRPRM